MSPAYKTVCYYDGTALWRKDLGKVGAEELECVLSDCTHLVYGYAGIDNEFEATSLDPKWDLLELDNFEGKGNFNYIMSLKKAYPDLIIQLSVGGNADIKNPKKYLTILESPKSITNFASSISDMAQKYGFDGVDLAWQFPVDTEKKKKHNLGSALHKVSKTIGFTSKDKNKTDYMIQFTNLIHEVKGCLNLKCCSYLSVSILPHINSFTYFDFPKLQKYVDHFTLLTHDFHTLDCVPKLASPLKFADNFNDNKDDGDYLGKQSIESQVKSIIAMEVNSNKLVLSLATFRRMPDQSKSVGTDATYLPEDDAKSIFWNSFEEPETAKQKAQYVKEHHLGGIAFLDPSSGGTKDSIDFSILRVVKDVI